MSLAIITGSAGLVGSEAAAYYASQWWEVIGIDNDMRSYFFGSEASTRWVRERRENEYRNYSHREVDIRNTEEISGIFRRAGNELALFILAAAQPSHDCLATDPVTDLAV